ncbi:MAG TPA: molybdopterin-dependent oxidoreductase [Vicinamibacterales bacterium]|nr:molybdopterin-dependent oxidoreductase [Vicinamibacterales bacterium]
MQRRQALSVLGAGAVAVGAYRYFGNAGMAARGVAWPPGLSPAITDAGLFYTVSKNKLFDPTVDASRWSLEINGLIGRSVSLALDDLRAMPAVAAAVTLACISNGVPARAIGNATWTGVRLRDVLDRAGGVDRAAVDLVWICADNYTDSIPVAAALDPGTLLVWGMNGEPLPKAHGAPVRAIVPGIYGMKNAKWIEAIECIAGDHQGYWQRRGWSDAAPYMTLSRFDVPRHGDRVTAGQALLLGGIAFAGRRGISRVDVGVGSPDDTNGTLLWMEADLQPELGPAAWRLWTCPFTPTPGRHRLVVCATDGDGVPQPRERRGNFPSGAHGWHAVDMSASA